MFVIDAGLDVDDGDHYTGTNDLDVRRAFMSFSMSFTSHSIRADIDNALLVVVIVVADNIQLTDVVKNVNANVLLLLSFSSSGSYRHRRRR
ncbi:Hypothetical predicted protein [Octopus vulgaris]|uniref:Uncharacterized protein n=1 Tax=Octopus vulgaris TaxID=6645 RepID=A0AA36ASQ0_OCTVU|nr:Hypothetical predicted protein [Octopus vulgaris]